MLRRRAAIWWVGLLCLGGVLVGLQLSGQLSLRSDIMALLPVEERDPLIARARERLAASGERMLQIYVLAEDEATAQRGARAVVERLAVDQAFSRVALGLDDLVSDARRAAARQAAAAHRFHHLAPADRARLEENGASADTYFIKRGLARLHGLGPTGGGSFVDDPFGLAAARQMAASAAVPPGVSLDRAGRFYIQRTADAPRRPVILAESRDSPFSQSEQAAQMAALEAARAALQRVDEDAELLVAGLLPHAAAASAQARREVSLIGGGALIGILLLMIWAFASLRPFLLTLLVLGGGLLLAGSATGLLFGGGLHVVTLVFGASLVGVAVDYCMHHFAAEGAPDGGAGMRRAVTLGMLTSVAAYASLALAPFPGLRQMAVFAAAGLAGSWLGVMLMLPAARQAGRLQPRARAVAQRWLCRSGGALGEVRQRRALKLALLLLPLLAAAIALGIEPRDDIRMLHSMPPELREQEARIAELQPMQPAGALAVILRADDRSALWQREQAFLEALAERAGALDGGRLLALTQAFSPPKRQRADYALLAATLYREQGPVHSLFEQAGLGRERAQAHRQDFLAAESRPLAFDAWLEGVAADALRALWLGESDGQSASMVLLRDAALRDAAKALAAERPGVELLDQVERLSALMASYRGQVSALLVLAYLAAALLLVSTMSAGAAARILLPPLLATAIVLLFWSLSGLSFTLFSLMGLVLLLGIGADYGIFLEQSRADQRSAMAAVMLSAMTTFLAFGLLALSQTPALRGFGISLAVGIPLTFLLASFLAGRAPVSRAAGDAYHVQ